MLPGIILANYFVDLMQLSCSCVHIWALRISYEVDGVSRPVALVLVLVLSCAVVACVRIRRPETFRPRS